jgi:hypothetical protein
MPARSLPAVVIMLISGWLRAPVALSMHVVHGARLVGVQLVDDGRVHVQAVQRAALSVERA